MTKLFEDLCNQLLITADTLSRYGFTFWAEKLNELRLASKTLSHGQMTERVFSLYGGFGTLMDLAVDPHTLQAGVSEESANQELLKAINALYEYVKRSP